MIIFNKSVNTGPWRKYELEDLNVCKNYKPTKIYIGELRLKPKAGQTENYRVLENGVTLLNAVYKMRVCEDFEGKLEVTCRGFKNKNVFFKKNLDYYNIDLIQQCVQSGQKLLKVDIYRIKNFNGVPFDVLECSF